MSYLCTECPGKILISMKANTGVKKAIAMRLRIVLEEEIRHFVMMRHNPIYLKTVTATQLRRYEQKSRKVINALRIVIHTLDPRGEKMPAWYDVIAMMEPPPPPMSLKRYANDQLKEKAQGRNPRPTQNQTK